jgi:hypothetical protein
MGKNKQTKTPKQTNKKFKNHTKKPHQVQKI